MLFGLNKRLPYFLDKEDGAGEATDDATGDGKAEDPSKDDPKAKGQEGGAGGAGKGKADEKLFTQKDLDAQINTRLERHKKQAEAEAEKIRKKAEEDALANNQKFEELAGKRLNEIEQLKTENDELLKVKEQSEKYRGALEAHLKTQIEKLPKPIRSLMEKLDPVEQIEFLSKNAKELSLNKKDGIDETDDDGQDKLNEKQEADAKKKTRRATRNLFH